jgi:acyl carrier protein
MTVTERIVTLVDQKLAKGKAVNLDETESFLASGLADSLGIMGLLESIETSFQITVEPDEFKPENLDSIAGIRQYLKTKGVAD